MVLTSKKTKNKRYDVNITINKIPNNCYECPFYYMPNPDEEGGYYEHWDCFLGGAKSIYGVALERPKDCPL